ncbi:hypothetical protein E6O75_ATG11692 [Venturia nashicola]|uniref:Uncharacterized protein n=1 Tax=Venturia nashicola TaxID=86259 RepID=A0A4Z1NZC7_9PEZI|nr:hypothetical protein E6O75_ATG11692 [Venturia nashicola]
MSEFKLAKAVKESTMAAFDAKNTGEVLPPLNETLIEHTRPAFFANGSILPGILHKHFDRLLDLIYRNSRDQKMAWWQGRTHNLSRIKPGVIKVDVLELELVGVSFDLSGNATTKQQHLVQFHASIVYLQENVSECRILMKSTGVKLENSLNEARMVADTLRRDWLDACTALCRGRKSAFRLEAP